MMYDAEAVALQENRIKSFIEARGLVKIYENKYIKVLPEYRTIDNVLRRKVYKDYEEMMNYGYNFFVCKELKIPLTYAYRLCFNDGFKLVIHEALRPVALDEEIGRAQMQQSIFQCDREDELEIMMPNNYQPQCVGEPYSRGLAVSVSLMPRVVQKVIHSSSLSSDQSDDCLSLSSDLKFSSSVKVLSDIMCKAGFVPLGRPFVWSEFMLNMQPNALEKIFTTESWPYKEVTALREQPPSFYQDGASYKNCYNYPVISDSHILFMDQYTSLEKASVESRFHQNLAESCAADDEVRCIEAYEKEDGDEGFEFVKNEEFEFVEKKHCVSQEKAFDESCEKEEGIDEKDSCRLKRFIEEQLEDQSVLRDHYFFQEEAIAEASKEVEGFHSLELDAKKDSCTKSTLSSVPRIKNVIANDNDDGVCVPSEGYENFVGFDDPNTLQICSCPKPSNQVDNSYSTAVLSVMTHV